MAPRAVEKFRIQSDSLTYTKELRRTQARMAATGARTTDPASIVSSATERIQIRGLSQMHDHRSLEGSVHLSSNIIFGYRLRV